MNGGIILEKEATSPDKDQIREILRLDMPFYFQNDTYAGDVSQLLAKVVIMLPADGKKCSDDQKWRAPIFIDRLPEAAFTDPQKPETRKSIVLTKKAAADADFFGYLSAKLSTDQVFSILATDIVRRVKDNDNAYRAAKEKWKTDNKKYMDDAGVCLIGIVEGAVQKTISRKKFTKVEGTSAAGAFGLKANGSYFSSDEEFESDYWFGVDVTWWKWPSKDKTDKTEKPTNQLPGDDAKPLKLQHSLTDAPGDFMKKVREKRRPDINELK